MPVPRPLPDDNYANLLSPPNGYQFFQRCNEVPFLPRAEGFEPGNAWWLAECALLAYERNFDTVAGTLASAGFPRTQKLGNWDAAVSPKKKSTQAFVTSGADTVIVSFRGTQADSPQDLITDLEAAPSPEGQPPVCKVHRGFQEALDEVWHDLQAALSALAPIEPVFFTGHSLGAALATLAAFRFSRSGGRAVVYDYGSPRVGDPAFRDLLQAGARGIYRFVNSGDFVTTVPLESGSYAHAGTEKYIDRDGSILTSPTEQVRIDDIRAGMRAHWKGLLLFFRVPPYIVGTHTPARYAVRTWNAIGAAGRPASAMAAG